MKSGLLPYGKGRIVVEEMDVAIFCLGSRLEACLEAARELGQHGIWVTVADARFCKSLETELVEGLARHRELLVTVGEVASGGFSAHVLHHLANHDLLRETRFRALTLPDRFIAHGSPTDQYANAGLGAAAINREIPLLRSNMRSQSFDRYTRSVSAHAH